MTPRRCREEDLPALFTLFREVYRHNPRMVERDFFDWQYRDTPLASTPGAYDFHLLEEGGEVVGFAGEAPVAFRHEGRDGVGCWLQHWYAPRGGSGGLALLAEAVTRWDNLFLLNFTAQAEAVYRALRVPMLPRIPRYLAILDGEAVARLCGRQDDPEVRRRLRAVECSVGVGGGEAPMLISCFDPERDYSPWHWPGVTGCCLRTGVYLDWRYHRIPRHPYRFLANARGELAVFRVEEVKDHPWSVVRVVEWTFAPERAAGAMDLLRAVTVEAAPILADFWCTAAAAAPALAAAGFVAESALDFPVPDLFRPTYHAPPLTLGLDFPPHRQTRTLDFSRWYVTRGESDVDRVKL